MILDLIVAVVVCIGFYLGYSRGLIRTVFDTLSIIIGILAALKLSPIVIRMLEGIITTSPALSFLLGVIITFMGVMLLIRFVSKRFEDLLKGLNINFINKMAGGALQALFFAYIFSMSLWMVDSLNVLTPNVKSNSLTYSLLDSLPNKGRAVFEKMKPIFKDFWDKTAESMDKINQNNQDQD